MSENYEDAMSEAQRWLEQLNETMISESSYITNLFRPNDGANGQVDTPLFLPVTHNDPKEHALGRRRRLADVVIGGPRHGTYRPGIPREWRVLILADLHPAIHEGRETVERYWYRFIRHDVEVAGRHMRFWVRQDYLELGDDYVMAMITSWIEERAGLF
jgi:hypothetical protein